jgi:hypothetical protein
MARYFTLEQAERALPAVEGAIREAIYLKSEYQTADTELREITRKIMASGGMVVDRDKVGSLRTRRDDAAERLKQAFELIQEHGCLVKDLDIGLLDFPTLYRGREVYLCWRLGETRIEFWHGVEEGFRGRKPIDKDFLDHHKGDEVS